LRVRAATWSLQAYSTKLTALSSAIVVSSGLFVEPHVFEAPAIVLAVGHHRQPLTSGCRHVAARK
jgi:hypothetical protein